MSLITGMLFHADQTHCMQLCEVQAVFSRHKAAGTTLSVNHVLMNLWTS
jgi:hypothetical protein